MCQQCRTLLLIQFTFLSSFLIGLIHAQLDGVSCSTVNDCKLGQVCHTGFMKCCWNCTLLNRYVKPFNDQSSGCSNDVTKVCGNCFQGFKPRLDFKELCESIEIKVSESTVAEEDASSELPSTGVYVACAFGGLFLGFVVGGSGTFLICKLCFKEQTSNETEIKKDIEMKEMPSFKDRKSNADIKQSPEEDLQKLTHKNTDSTMPIVSSNDSSTNSGSEPQVKKYGHYDYPPTFVKKADG